MRAATIAHHSHALLRTQLSHQLIRQAPVVVASTFATSFASRSNFCTTSVACSEHQAIPYGCKVARVPNRGVLQVSGRDTVKLLQGLVSNNVQPLAPLEPSSSSSSSTMVYAGFMNPQGRMLADVFIHKQQPMDDGSPRCLLDLDSRTLPSLLSFVKKFKLRSKVRLTDVSQQYHVIQAWSSTSDTQLSEVLHAKLALDPRCPGLGYRGVLPSSSDLGGNGSLVDGDEYTVHRIVNGIGEGAHDFPEGSSLPLENNLDYMNGVDFRKGCYVGQELTARTHHTGVVRKRLIPLSFYLPGTNPPTSINDIDTTTSFHLPSHLTEIRSRPVASGSVQSEAAQPTRGKAAGKFTSGIYNIGLGCLRLEQVQRWTDASIRAGKQDGLEMTVLAADGETQLMVKPWIPSWWPKQQQPVQGGEEARM
ncbi:related to IBA57 - mitochondrial iron-sulfur cluster assembly factor [Melanopsichium pennsylvanicum]|uniref:Related to IBA57 - mitochondrial iron-sulfur cluster assembly factor n=2 Tax=Melanopsichium pennsylvanicum TaxID=63383 RepID=A0AAJ4XMR4_9BASI|nr:potential ccr4 associated factor [Melanopsichium pennsylvanicum 4]SNX85719.1 related to IBA57 - mitochondrial iron-sulfur cluster assembly factor [Melanopsichium pennsylvanicum]